MSASTADRCPRCGAATISYGGGHLACCGSCGLIADEEVFEMPIEEAITIEHGPTTLRKAVLQQFVVEVRIENRREFWPTFRLPLGGVRELSRMVGPEGVEPLTLRGLPFSLVSPESESPCVNPAAVVKGQIRVQEQFANNALPKLEVNRAQR
jgi:hypothetical protein